MPEPFSERLFFYPPTPPLNNSMELFSEVVISSDFLYNSNYEKETTKKSSHDGHCGDYCAYVYPAALFRTRILVGGKLLVANSEYKS
jgi:hypothetical protein